MNKIMIKNSDTILESFTNQHKIWKNGVLELLSIGFWCNTNLDYIYSLEEYDVGLPHPKHFVDSKWEKDNRVRIVKYLKSGKTAFAYHGSSFCRFDNCQREYMGSKEFTDGIWIWPEGLSHYIKYHNVRLPKPFIQHMVNNNFKIRRLVIPEEHLIKVNNNYWIQWSAENTPPPQKEPKCLSTNQAKIFVQGFSNDIYEAKLCEVFGRWQLIESLGNRKSIDYMPYLSELSLGFRLVRNRIPLKTDVLDIDRGNSIMAEYNKSSVAIYVINTYDNSNESDEDVYYRGTYPKSIIWTIQEDDNQYIVEYAIQAQDEIGWRYYSQFLIQKHLNRIM